MKNFFRSLVPEAIQVPVKHILNKLRNQLEPELELLPFLVKRGWQSIDVGGNRGQYTYSLWRLGSRVDVFEPNPVCSRVLIAWASNKKSIVVHTVGLSDKSGVADLHIPVDRFGNEHDASASLSGNFSSQMRHEKVSIETLDSFKFSDVAFVKIDVEGHEYNVLKGGEKLFTQQRPSILIEVEQRHIKRPVDDIFALIQSWGYRGYFLRGGALEGLENFNVKKDQDLDKFATQSGSYINNFLFLNEQYLSEGRYSDLFSVWRRK